MDKKTYEQIYHQLNSIKDINRLSQEFSIRTGILSNIFHQKTVQAVKKYHYQVVRKAPEMLNSWRKGDTLLEIAQKQNFPAVLITSIILKEMGHKSKAIIKNPHLLWDLRLRNEVLQAIDNDLHYSPKAHTIQSMLGKMGEDIIHKWLVDCDIDFITESQMSNTRNTKTPDFLLHEPLTINGIPIKWVESKAVFADEREHNRYHEKQFKFYEELFGTGMVVYWYGLIDDICPGNYMIIDHTFFKYPEYNVKKLIDSHM